MTKAAEVVSAAKSSLTGAGPWLIGPAAGPEEWLIILDDFATKLAAVKVGLTDAAVVAEARRLKQDKKRFNPRVHIWTRDGTLKAQEPDAEPDPFL